MSRDDNAAWAVARETEMAVAETAAVETGSVGAKVVEVRAAAKAVAMEDMKVEVKGAASAGAEQAVEALVECLAAAATVLAR